MSSGAPPGDSTGNPGRSLLKAAAPAKVNLGLRILARRGDGLHELRSVFAPLDWCDELEIEIAPAARLKVDLELDS